MKFFVLGNHRELSIAEIVAVTGVSDFKSVSGDLLLLDTDMSAATLQDKLAGTIKVGSVIGELGEWDKEACADLIVAMIGEVTNRVEFGISVYDAGDGKRTKELRAESQKLGLSVKKRLKESGHPVRLVTSNEKTLSAVVITTNKLLERGGEFVLIVTKDSILVGQTEAVQDFEAWSKRDFGRPARDSKSGMLPPKLARMMINLTGADPHTATILDPFCGSGTVLMEAALMGFTRIIGSDIAPKAIADSQKNHEWLTKQDQLVAPITLFISPAQTLDQHITEPVDAIVTETYLGPGLHGGEHPDFIKKNLKMLGELYRDCFGTLFDLLKPGGTAVVAFPVFQTQIGEQEAMGRSVIEELGFRVANKIRYERVGQHVARDIVVLKR